MIELTTEEAKKQLARYDNEYYTPQTRQAHRMAIAALDATRFIPVTERMPQEKESVLILCKNGAMFTGFMAVYHDGPRWKIHTALNSTKLLNKGRVSHWMPLPASPRKDDGHD